MARFQKTRIHVVTAVLILLSLYAVGGLGYAIWVHSPDAAMVWAIVAGGALVAAVGYQRYVMVKRARAPQ